MHEHHISEKKVFFVILLNLLIVAVQIIGGVLSRSLALLSDAVHNLADAVSIFISYIAIKIGKRPIDLQRTFGYKRIEIIAAFINTIILFLFCIFLIKGAFQRLISPEIIQGKLMLFIAVIGLLGNFISIVLLKHDAKDNINIRAAFLHLLSDTLSSVAVIIGSVLIIFFNIYIIDALLTFLIVAFILYNGFLILKRTFNILMQATPEGIDIGILKDEIESIPGVENIHHIHIWELDDRTVHFEAHVLCGKDIEREGIDDLRINIENILNDKYSISHTTLQMEYIKCSKDDC